MARTSNNILTIDTVTTTDRQAGKPALHCAFLPEGSRLLAALGDPEAAEVERGFLRAVVVRFE